MGSMWFQSLFLIFAFAITAYSQEESCVDIDGRDVEHGLLFVPGPNVCTQCVCHHSEPKWCQTMFCNGPPYGCKNYKVGKTCCQFECLDPPTEKPIIELRELSSKNLALPSTRSSLALTIQVPITLFIIARI